METPAKPLRILAIVNLPWDARLGASRVWMELAEQWRSQGHVVEKFSLSDAFPGVRAARVTFALRQLIFIRKAAAFVRRHAQRFDVIDALIGALPFSKDELGFPGVIIARSVGLYHFYDRFEQSVERRWPRPEQGRFVGRLIYRFTRDQRLRACEAAVRKADLINVPNEEEAIYLRQKLGPGARLLVQPYGLTNEFRRALQEAAWPAEFRVAQKKICFIGMGSARKGAHDWAGIIDRVRTRVPNARFKFLGTMLDAQTIRRGLGAAALQGVEFISDYEPDELPHLLSDCTVAAFPSYVEGFGLAVLEQLAAGLPTVAYDTTGPRDIFGTRLVDLLVPIGNINRFGAALCTVLELESARYEQLSKQGVQAAADFSWEGIAQDTSQAYRALLQERTRPIVFVQPFSLGSAEGGARILRALLEQAPFPWRSICSSPVKPKPWRDELHVRSRPSWGRVEQSRLAALPRKTSRLFVRFFRNRLRRRCLQLGARAIHTVPHAGLDFAEAQRVARELSLPFFLSLHDDLAYTAAAVNAKEREAAMVTAWRDAAARFVVSEALGEEYCRRYGAREFQVVTDGLAALVPPRLESAFTVLRIYFMGLFHMSYERNLRALLEGIAIFEREHAGRSVEVTMRCEHVRPQALVIAKPVTVLPFADEAEVERDLQKADLLYIPIPFGEEHAPFARYSLSTKMVTYVGSGVPILYHGPTGSAAFELLNKHRAAIPITSLEPAEIAKVLTEMRATRRAEVAANALALAEREFMLADQYRKFWRTITQSLATG